MNLKKPSDREQELEQRELTTSVNEKKEGLILAEISRIEKIGSKDDAESLRKIAYMLKQKHDHNLYREAYDKNNRHSGALSARQVSIADEIIRALEEIDRQYNKLREMEEIFFKMF